MLKKDVTHPLILLGVMVPDNMRPDHPYPYPISYPPQVLEMLKKDVARFMILLGVMVPGYILAMMVLLSRCEDGRGEQGESINVWSSLENVGMSAMLMMFTLQTWPRYAPSTLHVTREVPCIPL